MSSDSVTFAVFFGNRGFFPAHFIEGARKDVQAAIEGLGHKALMMDPSLTRLGAVETPEEGRRFAAFLDENRGQFDGVVLCLPNFGDENGAIAALRDAGVPILIQAYPDDMDKMTMADRRDAFCGKFSIMDVFTQFQLPFSALKPHVSHPSSETFRRQLDTFARTCRVVKGLRRLVVGAVGARTTAFKTIRFDELALQKYGITTETFDLSDVFFKIEKLDLEAEACRKRAEEMREYTNFSQVPEKAFGNLVKLSVVIDEMVQEFNLDAIGVRCWIEMQEQLGISPCVLLSEFNNRLLTAACELDVCNAVAMKALSLASGGPSAVLDWNNNVGEDEDRCILFHCGSVAQDMMEAKGTVTDHDMIAKSVGCGCSYGCNQGRIKSGPFTYASSLTKDGELRFYLGEGKFTDDLPKEYFGCAGVCEIPDLQNQLRGIGYAGYRHHVSVSFGQVEEALRDAFDNYLGYTIEDF